MQERERLGLLQSFRDSIVIPLGQTDPEKWPIRSGRVLGLVSDSLAAEFFEDLRFLLGEGWSKAEVAKLFGNPTRLWRLSHHLLQGLRANGVSLRQQQDDILLVLSLISELKSGSPFLSDGANLLLAPEEVPGIVEDVLGAGRVSTGNEMLNRWAHRTAAVLWSYAETLYFVAHELGVEIHGPYSTSTGDSLLIRDFCRPRPSELWPEMSDWPQFERLRVAVIYRDFGGWLDVYNNLYTRPDVSMPSRAIAVGVWRDRSRVGDAELEELCVQASAAIEKLVAMVDSWSLEEVARKYVDVFWWRKHELSMAARGAWKPPVDVLERVVESAIPPASSKSPSMDSLRKQFDLTEAQG